MSLRVRLPLTYGAIALLTALALGAVLLLSLRGYYVQQERDYLRQNAGSVRELLSGLVEQDALTLANQVETLAFLTQTRIRLFSAESQLILDSGTPNQKDVTLSLSVEMGAVDNFQRFDQTIDSRTITESIASTIQIQTGNSSISVSSTVSDNAANLIPGLRTPFNFGLASSSSERSTQTVARSIPSPFGRDLGIVELSEGPAFGREIMRAVLRVLVMASCIAVLFAAGVGIYVSRQMTQPLANLTNVVEQMAAGDLATRSMIIRKDEIGRLSTSFNSMAARIEQIVRTLRAFVADAAHEIHTPLTALQTNIELAAQQPENPRHLQRAQTQTERLTKLTGDLLHLSRLESATTSLDLQSFDVTSLLMTQAELFASRAEQAEIAFHLHVPTTTVQLVGDVAQLRRVFDNLLDNALKFTQMNGEIWLGFVVRGDSAEITIRDTGIGIDGDINRIFDRFHRAPNATAHDGSGLGLAIVQHIIQAHDGSIHVNRRTDGSEFVVRLPMPINVQPAP